MLTDTSNVWGVGVCWVVLPGNAYPAQGLLQVRFSRHVALRMSLLVVMSLALHRHHLRWHLWVYSAMSLTQTGSFSHVPLQRLAPRLCA